MPEIYKGNARSITQPQENSADETLGTTQGDEEVLASWGLPDDPNQVYAILRGLRTATGAGNGNMVIELRRRVDASNHGHLRFAIDRTQVGFNGTNHWDFTSSGDFLPVTPESFDIGSASKEVDNIFLQNAATVSDERQKNDLGPIDGDQALAFLAVLDPRWYSYKDTVIPASVETIESYTEDKATGRRTRHIERIAHPEKVIAHRRPHAGFMAQQFKKAMVAAGIEDFAGYAYDEEHDTHLLRLMEMIGILTAAVKRLAEFKPGGSPDLAEALSALAEERKKSAAQEARIAELEAEKSETPPPVDPLGEDIEKARRANKQLVNGAEEAKQPIPEEIAALLDEGETFTHDVRRKLTERLNVELAELKNLRGLAGEDLKREAEIEKLLGLFARLGEI